MMNSAFPNGTVLVFYKGTFVPIDIKVLNQVKEHKPVELALRHGFSLEQQAKDAFEQLDMIEQKLVKYSKGKEIFIQHAFRNIFKDDAETMMSLWVLNVYSLVRMKKLKDDDMNGFLCVGEQFII